MRNKFKIITLVLTLGCAALAVYAQESRSGYTAFATGGKQFGAGANTNYIIIPNDSPVQGSAGALGAVPSITYMDVSVPTASASASVTTFYSTNKGSIFIGVDATNNPRATLAGATSGTTYGGLCPGVTSNAYWLAGVVPGIITNQYAVIQHQGVSPSFISFEPVVIASNAVVFWTNSFTNGANQVTALVSSNTAIQLLSGPTALQSQIYANDQIWFETTNYAFTVPSNSVTGMRFTQSSVGGITTGERGKPLLLMFTGSNNVANANAQFIP